MDTTPKPAATPSPSPAAAGALPDRLGAYRILSLLGEGASGRVYLAEEDAPRRRVALKTLRAAAGGSGFAARFEREAALTAALEHPNIARLYAAGIADTAGGAVPYLAMQHVEGRTLRAWMAANAGTRGADLRERVRLLAVLGRAVAYAHARGVLHRDLKPDNVMVMPDGQPVVLDFGIARAMGEADSTLTMTGQVFGTLPYLSSEALAGAAHRLDPRADVYSLGVIAYELVGGQLPYALTGASLAEALDQLQRPPPQALEALEPRARGDIATIVNKAMAQDPALRYPDAAAFAADLERWLDNRPIEARPPTAAYVATRFMRRHRALSAAVAVSALALVAATVVSVRYALAERAALAAAEARLAEREAVNQFLDDMLRRADPERAVGNALTVRDVLDGARLALRGKGVPSAVVTALEGTLGRTYLHLGEAGIAEPLLGSAKERARALFGSTGVATLNAELDYASALGAIGRADEAEVLLKKVQDVARPAAVLRQGDAELARVALRAEGDLLIAQGDGGDIEPALAGLAKLHERAASVLGADDMQVLALLAAIAELQQMKGDYPAALAETQRVLAAQERTLGPLHPETLTTRNLLANVLRQQGDVPAAELTYRALLEDEKRVLGADHPQTLGTLNNYTGLVLMKKDLALGDTMTADLLDRVERKIGPDRRLTATAVNMRGYLLDDLGRFAEAEAMYRRSITIADRVYGEKHPETFAPRNNLGMLLMRAGRPRDAAPVFADTVRRTRDALGGEHPYTAIFRSNYGECLLATGQVAAARRELQEAVKVLDKALGPDHERTKLARERLARALAAR